MQELIIQGAESLPLAQAILPEEFRKILAIMRAVAFLLAVGVLIFAGIMFGQGRTEAAIQGVVAAGLLALSATIVKIAFEQVGNDLD